MGLYESNPGSHAQSGHCMAAHRVGSKWVQYNDRTISEKGTFGRSKDPKSRGWRRSLVVFAYTTVPGGITGSEMTTVPGAGVGGTKPPRTSKKKRGRR